MKITIGTCLSCGKQVTIVNDECSYCGANQTLAKVFPESAEGTEKPERPEPMNVKSYLAMLDFYAEQYKSGNLTEYASGRHEAYKFAAKKLRDMLQWTGDPYEELTSLHAQNKQLQRWKDEHALVNEWWNEIDSFIRKHPNAKIGHRVSATALEWLKERDTLEAQNKELKEENERLKKDNADYDYYITVRGVKLEKDMAKLDQQNKAFGEMLEQSRREHFINEEDCWYSCPKSGHNCNDNKKGKECDCGADEWNNKISTLLNETKP